MLDHHWRPENTGRPFFPSTGLLRSARLQTETMAFGLAHLTSRLSIQHSLVLMSNTSQITTLRRIDYHIFLKLNEIKHTSKSIFVHCIPNDFTTNNFPDVSLQYEHISNKFSWIIFNPYLTVLNNHLIASNSRIHINNSERIYIKWIHNLLICISIALLMGWDHIDK